MMRSLGTKGLVHLADAAMQSRRSLTVFGCYITEKDSPAIACRRFHTNSSRPNDNSSASTKRDDIVLVYDDYWVRKVASGTLRQDAAQGRVAQRLQRLQVAMSSQYTTNAPILDAHRHYMRQRYQVNSSEHKNDRKQQRTVIVAAAAAATSAMSTPVLATDEPKSPASETLSRSLLHDDMTRLESLGTAVTSSMTEPGSLPLSSVNHHPDERTQQLSSSSTPSIPRGLYLYGSVGTGKSMLMDAFYEHTVGPTKRRYHFHEFMSQIHIRLHKLRTNPTMNSPPTVVPHPTDTNKTAKTTRSDDDDERAYVSSLNPVVRVALDMASEFTLLCLDEFQVVDIADAVILALLFTTLFRAGTILVTTSNRPVTQLYDDPSMSSIPFIQILQTHCIVHEIKSTVDYRQLLSSSILTASDPTSVQNQMSAEHPISEGSMGMFWVMPRLDAKQSLQEQHIATLKFSQHIGKSLGQSFMSTRTDVIDLDAGFRRNIRVEQVVYGERFKVANCTFDELCSSRNSHQYYGPGEYRAIARYFDAIIIQNIPILSNGNATTAQAHNDPATTTPQLQEQQHWRDHNEARRFITLVDELYEARTLILCSAAVPLSQLFRIVSQDDALTANSSNPDLVTHSPTNGNVSPTDPAAHSTTSALVSVKELPFAFRRAGSRLTELTSSLYWKSQLHAAKHI